MLIYNQIKFTYNRTIFYLQIYTRLITDDINYLNSIIWYDLHGVESFILRDIRRKLTDDTNE